ncbi:MAG: helix-turn-helix domain-containing protein, partial [Deltaproteobacteria bacterium]|nr:helix-turn-helix domain-containing protein [Deltaproteobacteria bacterium]
SSLTHQELLVYIFLVLVGDRNGISYYSYDKLCTALRICVDDYILARNGLIKKDLIAFDGHIFQILSLPEQPVISIRAPLYPEEMEQKDPATIHQIIRESLDQKP